MAKKTQMANKVLAVVLFVMLFAAAPAAWATDAPRTITKTHTYMVSAGDKNPAPKEIEEGGSKYKQVSTSEVVDPDYKPDMVTFTRTSTVQCWPENLATTKGSFAAMMDINDDGISGSIPLIGVGEQPVTAQRDYQAEQRSTYTGLATNDVSQIPTTGVFTLPETGNIIALERAGVSWQVETADANGVPTSYQAIALYRGVDTATVLDHYDVTANYAGEIPVATDERRVVTTIYEMVVPAAPAPTPASEPEAEPAFPWAAIVAAGVAAAFAGGGAVLYYRFKNVRLVWVTDGSYKQVAKLHAKKKPQGAGLTLEIPAKYNLATNHYVLILRPDITGAANIAITHLGITSYIAPVTANIDLQEQFSSEAHPTCTEKCASES